MELLALRLVLTPTAVLVTSVVQRRWGHSFGGRLAGLPFTSTPFLLLVLLTQGRAATAVAAHGVVAGQIVVVAFCVSYAHLASRARPLGALPASLAIAGVCGLALSILTAGWLAAAVVLLAAAGGLISLPGSDSAPGRGTVRSGRRGETLMRVAISGGLVTVLTGVAKILGPYIAGLLVTTPVILSVLATTTHRSDGAESAAALLRGALTSMPGTVLFGAVIAAAVVPLGGPAAFALATGALLLANRSASLIPVFVGSSRVRVAEG